MNDTYTREQLDAALCRAHVLVSAVAWSPGLDVLLDTAWETLVDESGPVTREQVTTALNSAANAAAPDEDQAETAGTVWQQDVLNLAINAAGYLLDHPDADLDEIIPASYAGDLGENVTGTVLGWIA